MIKIDLTDIQTILAERSALLGLYNSLQQDEEFNLQEFMQDNPKEKPELILLVLIHGLKTTKTLKDLDLSNSLIIPNQLPAFFQAIADNATLTTINLSNNRIDAAGIIALAEVIKNSKTLKAINLGYSNIRDEGAILLAEAVKNNKTIIVLNLQTNDITNVGVQAFIDILATNTTLLRLDFKEDERTIDAEKLDSIQLLIRNNKKIAKQDCQSDGKNEMLARFFHSLRQNEPSKQFEQGNSGLTAGDQPSQSKKEYK